MTLKELHKDKRWQLVLGGGIGLVFGFLLQRSQVTRYDVIMGQLLLRDFTVLKIMLTAIITGMLGIFVLERIGLVQYHIKTGSLGAGTIGGLIFGAGMALLGYCPGTNSGAVGQGSLDSLIGGVPGIIAGTVIYAVMYPALNRHVLHRGEFGRMTLPDLLNTSRLKVMVGIYTMAVTLFLLWNWPDFKPISGQGKIEKRGCCRKHSDGRNPHDHVP